MSQAPFGRAAEKYQDRGKGDYKESFLSEFGPI